MNNQSPYKRILLKLSGEVLLGQKDFGHDFSVVDRVALELADARDAGFEVCVVVGGGNIYRGSHPDLRGHNRAGADYIGMLATAINALALQYAIETLGVGCRVMSAIAMPTICEPYIRRRAIRHLEKGRIVIFAAGTGNPFFTTDTASSLRAIETNCDVLLKGTNVDGVYSADPKIEKDCELYKKISYEEVIRKDLKVMDTSAISLARDNALKIIVFSIKKPGMLAKVLRGEGDFTLVEN